MIAYDSRLLLAGLLLVGCSKDPPPTPKETAPEASAPSAKAAPIAPVATFRWTEKPDEADVTDGTIRGVVNGAAIEIKSVAFQETNTGWNMTLGEEPLSEPTWPHFSGQYFSINLPAGNPKAGTTWRKPLGLGDTFFQLVEKKGSSGTSYNAKNVYFVHFDSWDVKPYDPKGSIFQAVGRASGKVYVAMEGPPDPDGGRGVIGVAGAFRDAVIRYLGKPKH